MTLIDWIAIGVVLIFAIIGYCVGFGRALKFFTSGIFGIIISVVVAALVFKPVMNIEMVGTWGTKFNDMLVGKGTDFCLFLAQKIPTYSIIVGVVLFVVAQLARLIAVAILKCIVEIRNPFFRVLNRVLGAILLICVLVVLAGVACWIIHLIGNNTEMKVVEVLDKSALKLNEVYKFVAEMIDKVVPAV